MKQNLTTIFLLFFLCTFSGCYRYIDWAKEVGDQGCPLETCVCDAYQYVRSARVYDQFTTLGLFDALLLHDTVIKAYVCAYSAKYGLSPAKQEEYLQLQRDEDAPYISFYLLAVVPGTIGTLLTDKNPIWTVQLKIGNDYFNPTKLKTVEISPEYKYFFGKRFTIFKHQYLVQFDAIDANNIPLIGPLTDKIELVLRRVGHQTSMLWCLNYQQEIVETCNLSDDSLAYDLNTNL